MIPLNVVKPWHLGLALVRLKLESYEVVIV